MKSTGSHLLADFALARPDYRLGPVEKQRAGREAQRNNLAAGHFRRYYGRSNGPARELKVSGRLNNYSEVWPKSAEHREGRLVRLQRVRGRPAPQLEL